MGVELLGFRASSFVPWPSHDRFTDAASAEQFHRAELQETAFEAFGVELRAPLGVLLPEGWDANGTQPFAAWSAPLSWDARVTEINQDVLMYSTALLQERLPDALKRASEIADPDERRRVAGILQRLVEAVAACDAEGDPLYLLVSA